MTCSRPPGAALFGCERGERAWRPAGDLLDRGARAVLHTQLAALLTEARTSPSDDSDFLAHVLLAAVRADLVDHLGTTGMPAERMRAGLVALCESVIEC